PGLGGYYGRVTADFKAINENKTGFSSFALDALAHAGRVTGDKRYFDAAMVFFREVRDKMRDGPFIGSGSYRRDFMTTVAGGGPFGGGGRRGGSADANAPGPTRGNMSPPSAGGVPGPGGGFAARRHGINLHM